MILFLKITLAIFAALMAGWTVFIFCFTRQIIANFFRGEAPFVPSKEKYLPQIAEAMELSKDSVVCDLGCGDARVLVACCWTEPGARCIGFDKNITPYLWARLRIWALGLSQKIKIHKKDFFKADLGEATHIFFYLIPKQVERLEKKIEKELKKGAKVFSLAFELKNRTPQEIVLVGKEKLYVYEF